MALSSCDIGNPIYDTIFEKEYSHQVHITDLICDDEQNEFKIDLEYHYTYRPSEGVAKIKFVQVTPRETYYATEMSVVESVIELIRLYERRIEMECNVKVNEYKPEIKIC